MTSLKRTATADLSHEFGNTRRMLERVPEEHFDWKPHPKSMSLAELSGHIANLGFWMVMLLKTEDLDLATLPRKARVPTRLDELLTIFDGHVATVNELLTRSDDEAFAQTWTLRRGDYVIAQQPRFVAFRTMGISHMVHHRGQLSVYLRLLDVPVPGVYGPSADD